MNILDTAIVSNTEMIKNYKDCRRKAERLNKIFILKNNQLDAVLFSIKKYEKLSVFIEYLDRLDEEDLIKILQYLPKNSKGEREPIEQMIKDFQQNEKTMADNVKQVTNEVHLINTDVLMKMADIKKEVVEGHGKIMDKIKQLPKVSRKRLSK